MNSLLNLVNLLVTVAQGIVCGLYSLLILFILLMLTIVLLAVMKVWVMG